MGCLISHGPNKAFPDNAALFGDRAVDFKYIILNNRHFVGVCNCKPEAMTIFQQHANRMYSWKKYKSPSYVFQEECCEANKHVWISVIPESQLKQLRNQERTALLSDLDNSVEGSV